MSHQKSKTLKQTKLTLTTKPLITPIPEDSQKELPTTHTLKKVKQTPCREDLKEVSINIKQKTPNKGERPVIVREERPNKPEKALKVKGEHKKENANKQKSLDAFFTMGKSSENSVRNTLFHPEKENGSQETTGIQQSQPTNMTNTNNFFNNNEKIKMSALQKALFYKRLEGLYSKTIDNIPVFKKFTEFLRESLTNEAKNVVEPEFIAKMVKFCLLRFIFENPNESWHKVYKPLCCKDILNVKNTQYIKGWLEGFLKKAREKNDSKCRNGSEYSSDFNSELFDESSKDSHSRFKIRDFLKEVSRDGKWKFNTLLIRGKQGIGKSTAVFSAATDMEYEIIEINNSSKRSEKALRKIYEATQSQGFVSSRFKDFMLKNSGIEDQTMRYKKLIYVRDYDKCLDVDQGFKKTIHEFIKISKHPIILSASNEDFNDFNSNELDLLNFRDYSLEEIGLLLKIILEIEGNFRNFHKSNFFDEFFSQQNSDNSKNITTFANEEMFDKYLIKFKDLDIPFANKHSLANIKEIVYFFNGNLTELFTKFEFLCPELTNNPFQTRKYKFFLENDCFSYTAKQENYPIGSFPKELEHKKIKELMPFGKQTEVFMENNSFKQVKNLSNILTANTLTASSLENYSKFLENAQNLDILDMKTQKILIKSNFLCDTTPTKNKNAENNAPQPVKPKSNDLLGYWKKPGLQQEKTNEETPIFDIRVFKDDETNDFKGFYINDNDILQKDDGNIYRARRVLIRGSDCENLIKKIKEFKKNFVKDFSCSQISEQVLIDLNHYLLSTCYLENGESQCLKSRLRNKPQKTSVEKFSSPFTNKIVLTLLPQDKAEDLMKCSEAPWFLDFYRKKHQGVDFSDEEELEHNKEEML